MGKGVFSGILYQNVYADRRFEVEKVTGQLSICENVHNKYAASVSGIGG